MDYYTQIRWVDEYVKNIAPYIYVRKIDSLLIKIPNEAYKLNPQGLKIMKHLLSGGSVYDIIDAYPDKESVSQDMHNFFCDLRALLKGCFHEHQERRAIEKVPFNLSFNTLPVLSEIALTYRCNLSCKFCYASCGCKKNPDAKELTVKDVKKILSIIKHEAEVPSVSFTGGEPTLYKGLMKLIRYAKSQKMWTNLITNATLITKDVASSLKDVGLDSAQVSLEAGDAAVHDDIVRTKGAFSKTVSGLKELQEAGIRVHTNTTISRLNKESLLQILKKVKALGLSKFSMNMLMPQGNALENLKEVLITYTEIEDVILQVSRWAKELGLEFMWYSPTPMCIFNPVAHGLGNKGCAACDGLLSIAPGGDILPCSSYPEPMGNMLAMEGRFREEWQSPHFAFFQKKRFAHEICQECSSLAVCNGGCPLYWKQIGYQELISNNMEEEHGVFA